MKLSKKLKYGFLSATLFSSLLVSLLFLQPAPVLAAQCAANPSTDSQSAAQERCIKEFKDVCEKDFPASFCNSLTVQQINRCATDGNQKNLRANCLENIQENQNDPTNDEDEESSIGAGYNENDCSNGLRGKCGVLDLIVLITNVLAGLAGVVIVAAIIWGGIQYSTAGGDPSKVQAAKQKIFNAMLALILLIFGFSVVQWLVPGGLI